MQSNELRINHIKSFRKLSIAERLSWAFEHARFLEGFMDEEARKLNKILRKKGKKYFKYSDVAKAGKIQNES